MSTLGDLEIFAQVVRAGSLSAAARELNSSTGMISKRLTRFEQRLGARLLHRSTRRLTVTDVGSALYDRALIILNSIQEAEDLVSLSSGAVCGSLKISAPTAFGRMYLAPHLKPLFDLHPDLQIELILTDDIVDLVADGFDVAIRIAALEDSSLIAQRLAANHRVICASPIYLAEHGEPHTLAELDNHRILAAAQQLPWQLEGPEGSALFRGVSFIKTNSSEVVREAMISGVGIALRSIWEVSAELRSGAIKVVLPQYSGTSGAAIYAVYPTRRLVPPKVRALIDFLLRLYGGTPPWTVPLEARQEAAAVEPVARTGGSDAMQRLRGSVGAQAARPSRKPAPGRRRVAAVV